MPEASAESSVGQERYESGDRSEPLTQGESNPFSGVELSPKDKEEIDRLSGAREARLERESVRDPMTGLYDYNRPEVQKIISSRLELAGRTGNAAYFVEIDGDHLREVNNSYGHNAGDAVIRALASSLEDLRGSDLAFRLGKGEEFGLLLVNVLNVDDVKMVLQRILVNYQKNLEDLSGREREFSSSQALSFAELARTLTFSAGVVCARVVENYGTSSRIGRPSVKFEDVTQMRRRADQELYRAKGDEAQLSLQLGDDWNKFGNLGHRNSIAVEGEAETTPIRS